MRRSVVHVISFWLMIETHQGANDVFI
jgi:hypothetical protein